MPPVDAIHFLTRVRIPGVRHPSLDDIAASQAWFAAVGLLLGALLVAVDWLAGRALPDPSVDVIIVIVLAAVTGALHLDGLADAADGLFGGPDAANRLAIMRDVHRGTYAIVAVVSVLALKWAGLSALPAEVRVEALLIAPCAARFSMVVSIAAFPYARTEGLGSPFKRHAAVGAAACFVTSLTAGVALLGAAGLYITTIAAVVALAVGAVSARLVGGTTGDVYGATAELCEAALWLVIAACAIRGWAEPLLFA
jgi:adenosylcobinamide-GDP ribazoletransferase